MKLLINVSMLLVLFSLILEPVGSTAQGFSIPAQWEAEKVYVFPDDIANTEKPNQVEVGDAKGYVMETRLASMTLMLTATPLYILFFPACANASPGYMERKVDSVLHRIATIFQHISTAVKVELSNSTIMHKYFQS